MSTLAGAALPPAGRCAAGAECPAGAGGDGGEQEPVAMLQAPERSPRSLMHGREGPSRQALEGFGALAARMRNVSTGGEEHKPYEYCIISADSSCEVDSFRRHTWTVVVPGGEGSPYNDGVNMQCLDGSGFAFKFWKGSSDKLLIYMMGGGACFSKWSTQGITTGAFCSTECLTQMSFETGPLNMYNEENPYHKHSVLFIPLCGGDGLIGDVQHKYHFQRMDSSSPHAVQKGYRHALAAVDWLQSNEQFNESTTLADFTLQGCSSGTLGVQVWADALLSRFSYLQSRVVMDSYVGIFEVERQPPILQSWHTCDLPILAPAQQAACNEPEWYFTVNLTEAAMAKHKSTQFVSISSKVDMIQRLFYTFTTFESEIDIAKSIMLHGTAAYAPLDSDKFYRKLNKVFERYRTYSNWHGYLVDGEWHCFVCDEWMETAYNFGSFWSGPLGGAGDADARAADPSAADADFDGANETDDSGSLSIPQELDAVEAGTAPAVVCEGERVKKGQADGSLSYCDESLA